MMTLSYLQSIFISLQLRHCTEYGKVISLKDLCCPMHKHQLRASLETGTAYTLWLMKAHFRGNVVSKICQGIMKEEKDER